MRGEESNSSSGRCQDCGNQAKRDCQHLRCRTCCKSRGFICETHVKSTWVPVPLRHRHTTVHDDRGGPIQPNPKRYCRPDQPSSLGLQEGNFPGEASFPAAFRCVRVSSMDNVIDQYAYQTSVSIGGHTFTGILYDQGPEKEGTGHYVTGESSSSGTCLLHQENLFPTTTATSSSPYTIPFYAFTSTTAHFFDQYPKS